MSSSLNKMYYDPLMVPKFLRLNDAIERFTADMVAKDPGVFQVGSADLRYSVERRLFFALLADKELHDQYVASQKNIHIDQGRLSIWARLIAPYLLHTSHVSSSEPTLREKVLRRLYRFHGRAMCHSEDIGRERVRVLFLVIQSKFIQYLKPIADRLSVSYAFLVIDDQDMFDVVANQHLPRVHIELTPQTVALTESKVRILGSEFEPGVFDNWPVRFNAIRGAIAKLRPDCIVIPEGNADIYELVNQSAKVLKVPTLCVQQGWAPIVHPGFRNMSYTRMCVWGEGFADLLSPYNPNQEFVATGNHNIHCRPQGDIAQRKAVGFFLQNGASWMTEVAWHETLDLIRWTAESNPDLVIRVRAHPGQPLTEADLTRFMGPPNIRVMDTGKFGLDQVLTGCRAIVAMNSTTILEAAATGAVPVILDVNGFGPYNPDIASLGAAIEVTEFEKARESLQHLLGDDEFCRSFAEPLDNVRRSYFTRDGDRALDAIVSEIDDLRTGTAALKYRSRSEAPVLHSKNPVSPPAPGAKPIVFLVNQISSHGHLDMYARLYSQCLLDLGYRVVLIAERDAGVKSWIASKGWTDRDFNLFERDALLENERPVGSLQSEQRPLFKRMLRVWKHEGSYGVVQRLIIYCVRPFAMFRSKLMQCLSSLTAYSSSIERVVSTWLLPNKGVDLRPITDEINAAMLRIGAKPSFVFFLYLDMINESRASCRSLTRKMKTPWAGILFHPRCLESQAATNVERYFKAENSAGAAFLNPNAIKPYQTMLPGKIFGCLPDVTDASLPSIEPEIVKTLRTRADGRTIVLALGSISPHKGVIDLIDVIGRLDPQKFFFALVGEVFWSAFGENEPKIRSFCNNPPENCLVQTGYIKDERDMNAVICDAGILYAVYNNFKDSSNTLTKASIFKKPIIVSDEYLMGEHVKNYRLGAAVKYGDLDAIANSLASLANGASSDFGFEAYASDNSYHALLTSLGRLTERWVGKGVQTAAPARR